MTEKKTVDMTTGSPFKHILGFMLPTLIGYLFQQFYSLVDTVIIGRFLGEDSLAAVGSTGAINFMIIGFCMGLCTGFAIPIAQKFGAKNYVTMRKFVANAIWTAAVLGTVITVVVYLLCMNILKLLHTPSNIIDDAYIYISILFIGIPVTIMYNMASGIMRSLGDSRTPVYFLLISSGLNIVLDIVMVQYMGIAGPAWATVISQLVSGLLCIAYMRKKFEILRLMKEDLPLDFKYVGKLLYVGIPMGLQYSITAIGSVVLQSAVNVLGSVYVASSATALKISMFFCCPYDALGSTAATFSGQNMGAKEYGRISEGMKWCNILGCVYAVIAFAVLSFFGVSLANLFIKEPSAMLLQNVSMYLKYNSMFYIFLVLVNVVRFTIQGMGYSILAILAGVFEMIARSFAGSVLVPVYGYKAACLASPLAWVLADIFLIIAYVVIMRKLRGKTVHVRKNVAAVRPAVR
ncbi:MAG: MATE family efflux transporter [Eubacterium sp.]|nr:MATE family efflux transporter [Eubacterium sp.]